MVVQGTSSQAKKQYVAPRLVDFGRIEVMTGECIGICLDGNNGAGQGG